MSKIFASKPTHASAMKLFSKAHEELQAAHAHNQAEKADLAEKLADVVKEETAITKSLTFFNNLFGTTTPEVAQETKADA